MKKFLLLSLSLILAVGLIFTTGSPALAEDPPPIEWVRQFGTTGDDSINGVAVDSTGIYVVGRIEGTYAFVRKYDVNGTDFWTDKFGTSSDYEHISGVAVDSTGIYVAGYTNGALGDSPAGGYDAFVRKYNASGDIKWTKQFGTRGNDRAYGVAVYNNWVYVAGYTDGALGDSKVKGVDAFVRKYDTDGNYKWVRQFGTTGNDLASGVAAYCTGVYVAGYTNGSCGQSNPTLTDAFVRKYDTDGNYKWVRQFETNFDDVAMGVAVDSTGIYVAGFTSGTLGERNFGANDAFIVKLGAPQCLRQYVYSVKFLCGRGSESFGVEPADYATAINIHNFHDEAVVLRKKAVIANREDEPAGMVSQYKELCLGPNEAVEVDCLDICGLVGVVDPVTGRCMDFLKGFVVIESSQPLNIVAVYTSSRGGFWSPRGFDTDIEYISPVVSP